MATENEQLSTWLPPDEAQALRMLATAAHRSVSLMIRLIILDHLKRNGAVAPSEQGKGNSTATEGA